MFDTNFLLIPYQFKVDIFEEIKRIVLFKYKLCVLDKTIEELKKIIKEQKGKHKLAAKLGLELVKSKHINIIHTKSLKNTDDTLAELSKKGYIIATQDKGLKVKIKKGNLITLRQKKYIGVG